MRKHRIESSAAAGRTGPQAAVESTFFEGVYAYVIRPNVLSRRL